MPGLGDHLSGQLEAAPQGQVNHGLLQRLNPLAGEGGDVHQRQGSGPL